ncbi:MAG: DUF58 domain-containing protein [Luteimonas sp.]|nr:DUF58 domain-containing protein [Luteimonas sp.]
MRPAPFLVVVLAFWAVLGVAASFGWLPPSAWQLAGAVIAVAALLDLLRLRRRATPEVVRALPEALPIGIEREVTLHIESGPRRQRVDVFDLHPGGGESSGLPRSLLLPADTVSSFGYRLRPTARGDFQFDGVQLRLLSPWRLWRQSRVAGVPQTVRVFPNFAPLARFALLSAEQASRMVGAHLKRRRGEGTDFHQMREYRIGDSLRQIDWKATARARKLISREYQDEKNQQLIVVLDTGRRMLARDGALAHFDHALDASLVVSYLALRQGDAVGLFATGGEQRWVAPQRSLGAIDTLLRASYDLQPQPVATDYLAAATGLSLRQRRRGLLMLVTNLRDEDSEDLLAAVRMLQRRHLVVVASLRERAIDEALDADVRELPDALRAAAAARYLAQRAAVHDALRHQRVMVLDVTCEQLPAALVEKYLAIKRDGML